MNSIIQFYAEKNNMKPKLLLQICWDSCSVFINSMLHKSSRDLLCNILAFPFFIIIANCHIVLVEID